MKWSLLTLATACGLNLKLQLQALSASRPPLTLRLRHGGPLLKLHPDVPDGLAASGESRRGTGEALPQTRPASRPRAARPPRRNCTSMGPGRAPRGLRRLPDGSDRRRDYPYRRVCAPSQMRRQRRRSPLRRSRARKSPRSRSWRRASRRVLAPRRGFCAD